MFRLLGRCFVYPGIGDAPMSPGLIRQAGQSDFGNVTGVSLHTEIAETDNAHPPLATILFALTLSVSVCSGIKFLVVRVASSRHHVLDQLA